MSLRLNCQFVDYRFDEAEQPVNGVAVKYRGSDPEEIIADLVVDTTGRAS